MRSVHAGRTQAVIRNCRVEGLLMFVHFANLPVTRQVISMKRQLRIPTDVGRNYRKNSTKDRLSYEKDAFNFVAFFAISDFLSRLEY